MAVIPSGPPGPQPGPPAQQGAGHTVGFDQNTGIITINIAGDRTYTIKARGNNPDVAQKMHDIALSFQRKLTTGSAAEIAKTVSLVQAAASPSHIATRCVYNPAKNRVELREQRGSQSVVIQKLLITATKTHQAALPVITPHEQARIEAQFQSKIEELTIKDELPDLEPFIQEENPTPEQIEWARQWQELLVDKKATYDALDQERRAMEIDLPYATEETQELYAECADDFADFHEELSAKLDQLNAILSGQPSKTVEVERRLQEMTETLERNNGDMVDNDLVLLNNILTQHRGHTAVEAPLQQIEQGWLLTVRFNMNDYRGIDQQWQAMERNIDDSRGVSRAKIDAYIGARDQFKQYFGKCQRRLAEIEAIFPPAAPPP